MTSRLDNDNKLDSDKFNADNKLSKWKNLGNDVRDNGKKFEQWQKIG